MAQDARTAVRDTAINVTPDTICQVGIATHALTDATAAAVGVTALHATVVTPSATVIAITMVQRFLGLFSVFSWECSSWFAFVFVSAEDYLEER